MKKYIVAIILSSLLFTGVTYAQTLEEQYQSALRSVIALLLKQIELLTAQLKTLQENQVAIQPVIPQPQIIVPPIVTPTQIIQPQIIVSIPTASIPDNFPVKIGEPVPESIYDYFSWDSGGCNRNYSRKLCASYHGIKFDENGIVTSINLR